MAGLVIQGLRLGAQALARGMASGGTRAAAGAGTRAATSQAATGAATSGSGVAGHVAGGATAAGAAAAAHQRMQEAERAGTRPIADGATREAEDTSDQCQKCPPDCGVLTPRNHAMSEISRAYQARITGLPPGQEWVYSGIDFDGFRSSGCTLLEAKAQYDQFFDAATGEPKWFYDQFGKAEVMVAQARRQSAVVMGARPAQLHWHFMQPLSHAYFTEQFEGSGLTLQTFLTP